MSRRGTRARVAGRMAATAAGLVASRAMPPLSDQVHPVARFGTTMTEVEGFLWRDDRRAGVLYAGIGTGLAVLSGRVTRSTTAMVAVCAAGAQLRDVARAIAGRLEAGELDVARAELPALVGRDPAGLDEAGIVAAAIESVAENSVDAVFGPAVWGAAAGAPGVAVHRALNTMDAMVGRRDRRYERFGWAAARADDVANLVPARLFVLALVAVCPERAEQILRAVRADAPAHPSPNAGVAEAAMAGALGVELGGPLRYGGAAEHRPTLGDGPRPGVAELHRAIGLARRAEDALVAALTLGALFAVLGTARTSRRRRRHPPGGTGS